MTGSHNLTDLTSGAWMAPSKRFNGSWIYALTMVSKCYLMFTVSRIVKMDSITRVKPQGLNGLMRIISSTGPSKMLGGWATGTALNMTGSIKTISTGL